MNNCVDHTIPANYHELEVSRGDTRLGSWWVCFLWILFSTRITQQCYSVVIVPMETLNVFMWERELLIQHSCIV